jgi:fumarate reductase subunit D
VGLNQLWDFVYLLGFFVLMMWVAMHRMEKRLIK